jgi:hypothetical protein
MKGLLIDDKGKCWPDDGKLARRIGYHDPRADLPTFAVCERGFIHLGQRHGTARVSVREHRFNLMTFMGAVLELGRMDPAHIVLRVLGDEPPAFYMFSELCDFAAQVRPLAAGQSLEMGPPRLAEVRDLGVLNSASFAGARPIVDLWRYMRGEFSDDIYSALIAGGVLDRMILTRRRPRSDRLVVEEFGSSIKFLSAADIVGRDLDDQPDREYGAWTAESYRRALRGRRLRVESCRARIRQSTTTAVSVRYDRVLMPWWAKVGELFTMCVSIEREKPVLVPSSTSATF